MDKLKLWNPQSTWEESESLWEVGAKEFSKTTPIKGLTSLPNMVGISEETAKRLKWKSFKWMTLQDHDGKIRQGFLTHPLRYGTRFLKSILKGKSYTREGDFFLYGIQNLEEFQEMLKNREAIFVMGFSYCHKPFECPSGRFTPDCIHDPDHPVCRQCFIGKAINAAPTSNTVALLIPTVHYIGGKMFEIVHQNPGKTILFMITACELTLEMFGDFGNMVEIKGIGVRLDGRICNTMKAFELSEKGIKPGLTVVLDETKQRMLELIRLRRNSF